MKVFGTSFQSGQFKVYLPNASLRWSLGSFLTDTAFDNLALVSFGANEDERIDIRSCFDDTTHVFAFGKDPSTSQLSVSLLCFLGNPACGTSEGSATLSEIRQIYEDNRVYAHPTAHILQIGELLAEGLLVRLAIGSVDPSTQTCIVSLTFLVVG